MVSKIRNRQPAARRPAFTLAHARQQQCPEPEASANHAQQQQRAVHTRLYSCLCKRYRSRLLAWTHGDDATGLTAQAGAQAYGQAGNEALLFMQICHLLVVFLTYIAPQGTVAKVDQSAATAPLSPSLWGSCTYGEDAAGLGQHVNAQAHVPAANDASFSMQISIDRLFNIVPNY